MYRGAIITETQANILKGLMFSENSFFSPFQRYEIWYISEAEVLQNTNQSVSWVNSLPLVDLPPLYIWHDETKSIQIIQSNDDCLNMLGNYPQIAVYRKDNNIETIRENGLVYVYVNTLLPEHRALLEEYNAEINEK
jgi:hypothetical protein